MKRPFNWISLLFMSAILAAFLCGCQGISGKSPNQRSVAQSMALDLLPGEKPVLLTLRVLDEEGSPEGPDTFQTVQAQGESITDALGEISQQLGKDIFLRDIRLVLLGDALCQSGIDQFQNFLVQSYQIRPRVSVAAAEGQAARFLQSEEEGGEAPIDLLTPLLEWNNRPGNSAVTVMELERERNASEGDCAIPLAAIDSGGKAVISGTAIFTGGRVSQRLNNRETEQLAFLSSFSDPRQSVIHIEVGQSAATLRLTGKKGRIHGESNLGLPRFTAKFSFEFQLLEAEGDQYPSISEMEAALEEYIENAMAFAIQKAVFEGDADVMGLAAALRRDNMDWWNQAGKEWRKKTSSEGIAGTEESIFQKSVFLLDIDCRITQTDVSIPIV